MKATNDIYKQSFSFPSGTVQCLFDISFDEQFPSPTVIITDENVFAFHQNKFSNTKTIVIPAGEEAKTQATVDYIINQLIDLEISKEDTLLGVGGGVVSDLAGYAAAIYKRGMKLQLMPTTLLGMIDAGLGGKNGVNVGRYKNMVGTIYQPEKIWFCYDFLSTLPVHEWRSGMAEMIKHACIADEQMFDMLEKIQLEDIMGDFKKLNELVQRNVKIKMNIVEQDELDKSDRHLLNFGHTFGHAIEKLLGITHGSAISIGMVCACRVSEKLIGLHSSATQRVLNLLEHYLLPLEANTNSEELFELLVKDKKRVGDDIHFVLLPQIGQAKTEIIPLSYLHQNIKEILR
ncbi:MAG: 3-dehydroquinate synthase [Ferruginibacter sp.]|nr:3-dehydroquinate synthase [Ferruginibacter sp.]